MVSWAQTVSAGSYNPPSSTADAAASNLSTAPASVYDCSLITVHDPSAVQQLSASRDSDTQKIARCLVRVQGMQVQQQQQQVPQLQTAANQSKQQAVKQGVMIAQ